MNIDVGDTVTWTEHTHTWIGVVVRVGTIHSLVRPIQPPGTANWMLTSKLTKIDEREVERG